MSWDLEAPSVSLADGVPVTADLVIAADGVKSVARKLILSDDDVPPQLTGFAAYRATVDRGEDKGRLGDVVASGETSTPIRVLEFKECFGRHARVSEWDPRLVKVVHMIDKTMKWPLLSGKPLKTWTAQGSKTVLLGDAAHAMVPYMSQGAAMAVEDGAALATVLSLVEDRSDLPLALQAYERERMKRSGQMQEASLLNGKLWHFEDGPEQQARDESMRPEVEGKNFSWSANQWSDPVTQWWAYGYDAEEMAVRAWQTHKTRNPGGNELTGKSFFAFSD